MFACPISLEWVIKSMKLSIVIPAYNEEKRIKKTLTSYTSHFDPIFKKNYEILVVCDGCIDNTAQVVKNFSRKHKNVLCLEFSNRAGKGGGVIRGFKAAKGDIIGFVDADDAFDINGVQKLINLVNSGHDFAIASKWKGRKFLQVTEPFSRKVASRVWNLIVRILFGLKVHDVQAGAKFLNRKVLEDLPPLHCTGFEFDAELLWRVSQKGFSIKELYIPSTHEEESKFRMRQSMNMLIGILKARFYMY